MSKKEILLLSAAIGFVIIWILDLRAGTPPEINTFWTRIFYHYSWLMMAVGCLFYFQYVKQIRLKKEEQQKPQQPIIEEKDQKKAARKALLKGKK